MDNVEFDAPEVQQQLESAPAPVESAWVVAQQKPFLFTPPRLSGGIPQPYKPVVSERQVKLHSFHLAQDCVAAGCPLCPDHGPPLIESKKPHNFTAKKVEDDVPQWFLHMCRNWRGVKRIVQITLERDRKCAIHAYPAEWSIVVRRIPWRLFPTMRAHIDVRQCKIPDDLQKYVPIIEAQIKTRVKEFLSGGNSRKPGRKRIE